MSAGLKIAIGSDHGGYELKQELANHLRTSGHEVHDCGTHSTDSVDYPRFAFAVARQVAGSGCDLGIIIDGAGIGSAMAANKVRGIRAAACYNEALASNSREHNGANVLTLGAGQINLDQAKKITDTFIRSECTEPRHQRRVNMIMDIESGRLNPAPPAIPVPSQEADLDLNAEDIQRVTQRVRQLLVQSNISTDGLPTIKLSPAQIAQLIDHTLLEPDASKEDVARLCQEAIEHGFWSVCVNSVNVRDTKNHLRGSPVKLCCVVGFPLGAMPPDIKAAEARKAIREGADEIDMVVNVGALKSGDDALALEDIRAVAEACKERGTLLKVILETALLTDEEKVRACEFSMRAGADFVKTSTGFSSGGATVQDIALMASTVASRKLGVKASGGVRTYEDVIKMVEAGATRIGASSSIRILEEAKALAEGREYIAEKPKGDY